MRIIVHNSGDVVATAPKWLSDKRIKQYVEEKHMWILETLAKLPPAEPTADYAHVKEELRTYIKTRLAYFNEFYKFAYGRISIKRQKTIWGSCSAKGNLNFNYKLHTLPKHLSDYVIVHELCHIRELNHSERFWKLVALQIPDYKARQRELATISLGRNLNLS